MCGITYIKSVQSLWKILALSLPFGNDLNKEKADTQAVVTQTVRTSFMAASDHLHEAHPNRHIYLAAWTAPKVGRA